jgi:hypothetical protein
MQKADKGRFKLNFTYARTRSAIASRRYRCGQVAYSLVAHPA